MVVTNQADNNRLLVSVVSHTHWDRAWYVTFQEFRARLVRLVDRLIDLLEHNPQYSVFMLDGQMIVLEDYLEVRPHRQGKLEELCKAGRIKVGPWYVLADEFLVSPEALIRNLQIGHRMGISFGGVSKIGYVPDGFGHIAQLPQILRGFGIDNAFFWRGIGEEGNQLGTEFTWKAPDGSTVTTIWMPFGYHNISNLGYPIHWGDTSQIEFDLNLALEQIQKSIDSLIPFSNTGTILLMNGIDHEEAEPRLNIILETARQRLNNYQFIHTTLEKHLEHVRASQIRLPEFTGEFRWGKYSEILQGVYATRIHLKQCNHRIETLYERYAEPLSAIAWMSKAQVPEGTQDLLWTGWRWLLKNHPHDDIYGSGIDPVHAEMIYRFDQAEQIGKIIVRDSLRHIAQQVDFTQQTGMPVLVYNPLGWERTEIATGDLDFDFDDPCANTFQIIDHHGKVVPHQVLNVESVFWMETLKANRKRRVRVAFPTKIPACGFSAYYVQPSQEKQKNEITSGNSEWSINKNGGENRFLSFEIAADGTISIYDKLNNQKFENLGYFEDIADAGDEYSFCPLEEDEPICTKGHQAEINRVINGPNLASFSIKQWLDIPVELTPDRQSRVKKNIRTSILSTVTVYRDQPGLFIETEVDNQARDHKLSAIFPTSINTEAVFVDQPFMVARREIDLPDSTGWVEDPTPMMHQRAFIDIYQNNRGLAIFNRGLPAVEVTRHKDGVHIALTLLRCVGWLSRDDLRIRRVAAGPLVPTPGAQCPGRYKFEYAIFPHAGTWQNVYQHAYNYIAPLLVTRADTHEGLNLGEMNITRDDPSKVITIPFKRSGILPDHTSLIEVDPPEIILSALFRAQDGQGLIVRLFNITDEPLPTRLTSFLPIKQAWLTNFLEEFQTPLNIIDNHQLIFTINHNQVVTIYLKH